MHFKRQNSVILKGSQSEQQLNYRVTEQKTQVSSIIVFIYGFEKDENIDITINTYRFINFV